MTYHLWRDCLVRLLRRCMVAELVLGSFESRRRLNISLVLGPMPGSSRKDIVLSVPAEIDRQFLIRCSRFGRGRVNGRDQIG
jgi:hypothetical protein